ncbi:peroxisomal Multifunctional enzyme type 2 [Dermatophagoides pteronyssinus]|uniref:peroxisomal Multifunctional enzyme type 2 n=1 Tax=Dermatophagoides pteronyssinus TaxID=6956 RepID=UPI003F67C552
MMNDNRRILLDFHGKVAVITGAARGLGREYALLLASRGASIIVNDLGGDRDGTGKSSAADLVVNEIRQRGGQAVADYNSVEEGEKIVQTAIDNFGRIDILINNAGILRDKSMMKMTPEDFDLVHRVHLRGSFLTTKAAWPYFRQQNYGRIIMTASPSGIYGNFGQANYSSAKLGLLALAKTLAIEGSKYDIKCNTIVPVAASRLTEDLLPEDIFNLLQPSCVAPMVGYLCHESCPTNGDVIEAAGGYFGRYQWQRSRGKVFTDTNQITIEDIQNNWQQITGMSEGYSNPTSMEDHTVLLMTQLRSGEDINESITNQSQPDRVYIDLTVEDAILYALSVGVSTEEPNHLRYLYENDENFSVLPSLATTISLNAVYQSNILDQAIRQYGLEDNLMRTLHGEQYLRIYRQIPCPSRLACETKILDVLDKGSAGALIIIEVTTYDDGNSPLFYNQLSFFMIGSGNFGGKRHSEISHIITTENVPNDRSVADWIITQQTTDNQAAIFRLCGDKNPLHIDSNFSKIAGFNQPILHGLCALGFACRHILAVYADYDCRYFDSIKVRFTGTIRPGQTIETRTWKSSSFDQENLVRIHFECFVRETGSKIISSSFVDLKTPLPSPKMAISSANIKIAPGNENNESSSSDHFICKVDRIFDEKIRPRIAKHSELIPLINTVCQFNITKQGKLASVWILDMKNGNGEVYYGARPNLMAECTLTVEDDALVEIFEGRDEPMLAFIGGRLQVSGNITAAQKLQQLWSEDEPITPIDDNEHQQQNDNNKTDDEDDELLRSIPTTGLKSDIMFTIIRNRMHEEPEIMKRLTASYQFNILLNGEPKTIWSAENKTNPGGCVYNKPFMNGKPDCMLTAEDDDLIKLMFGKLNPQRAFMMGKLKVKGNILLLQRLYSLWLELQKMGKTPELPFIVDLMSKTDLKPGIRSEMMIVELIQRLIRLPYLCKEIRTLIGFEIFKDGEIVAEYQLDFGKNDRTGVFDRGLPEIKPFTIMTATDDDFVRLTYHRFTLEQAIESGRIKIRGDHSIIPKISIIFKTPTSRVKL